MFWFLLSLSKSQTSTCDKQQLIWKNKIKYCEQSCWQMKKLWVTWQCTRYLCHYLCLHPAAASVTIWSMNDRKVKLITEQLLFESGLNTTGKKNYFSLHHNVLRLAQEILSLHWNSWISLQGITITCVYSSCAAWFIEMGRDRQREILEGQPSPWECLDSLTCPPPGCPATWTTTPITPSHALCSPFPTNRLVWFLRRCFNNYAHESVLI